LVKVFLTGPLPALGKGPVYISPKQGGVNAKT